MKTSNEKILSLIILRQVQVLRLARKLSRTLNRTLSKTNEEIRGLILLGLDSHRNFSSPSDKRKFAALQKKIVALRKTAFAEIKKEFQSEIYRLGIDERDFIFNMFKEAAVVELVMNIPDAQVVRNVVNSRPFQGRILSQWVDDLERDDIVRIMKSISIGMTQGEDTKRIAGRAIGLQGADKLTKKHITTIVNTAISHVTNATRREFAEFNQHIFSEEIFVATLDGRTTAICRGLDSKIFKVGEGPIPPLHPNCRSLRAAFLEAALLGDRPAKPFTRKMLLREYTKSNRLSSVDSRKKLPRGHKGSFDAFERIRVRELTGTVPAKLSYNDWLKDLPRDVVEDILGVSRAKLFLDGDLSLSKFVDFSGREFTLKQLARSQERAFKLAGLNPAEF